MSRGGARSAVGRLRQLSRSMLAQMILAATLFVIGGVYFYAIKPILQIPTLVEPDPLRATAAEVNERMQDAMFLPPGAPGSLAHIDRDPLIRAVRARNPGFRYFAIRNGRSVGDAAPRYFSKTGLDRLDRARAQLVEPSLCTQMQRPIRNPGESGYIYYHNCGTLSYIEFDGIRHPVPTSAPPPLAARARWLWLYSRGFLVPSVGVFLLVTAVLLVNIVRIRRVVRLTRRLGSEPAHRPLSEDGLPGEIVPLVVAVNQMIARADESQRARKFFLSAAAHELRTPLTVMRTRLEMMEDGNLKTKLLRDLSRLISLSNDLLTLISIDARERPRDLVDLSACGLNVMAGREAVAAAADVTLRFVEDRRFVEESSAEDVVGDAALIEVAVANMVDNAISFAPPGSEVTVTRTSVGLEVRDVGQGLHAENVESLFEPFVRSSTRRSGHGLGLAIVKAVADLHGGTVTAANAEGGGARFVLALAAS